MTKVMTGITERSKIIFGMIQIITEITEKTKIISGRTEILTEVLSGASKIKITERTKIMSGVIEIMSEMIKHVKFSSRYFVHLFHKDARKRAKSKRAAAPQCSVAQLQCRSFFPADVSTVALTRNRNATNDRAYQ